MKKELNSPKAPGAIGPYSQAVMSGILFCIRAVADQCIYRGDALRHQGSDSPEH